MTWVHDRVFAGGGDSLPGEWAEFAAQTGVSAILHLRPSAPAAFLGPTPEAFLWMSIDDEEQAGTEARRLAGTFIADCLAEGRRVLLHAERGRHRARWCYVAYQILVGASTTTALRRAAQAPWMTPYRTDPARWEAFARALTRPDEPPPVERAAERNP